MKKNKELIEKFRVEYEKVFKGINGRSYDCTKDVSQVFEISDGKIVEFGKARIETDFWFGYSDIGQGPSFDEMHETIDEHEKNIVNFFVSRNTRDTEEKIESLKNTEDTWYKMPKFQGNDVIYECMPIKYYDLSWHESRAKSNGYEIVEINDTDRKALITAYENELEDMMRRCKNYLKRFGTKKLHFNTYWIDR